MKGLNHLVLVGILAFLIGCDNGTTLVPTYDSVTINLPTAKIETLFGTTFFGSGAQFTASVNGSNNPRQTVTWTILGEGLSTGTSLVDGLLIVAIEDHGRTFSIKATSTVDTSLSDILTIMAVRCLPSDFYGNGYFHVFKQTLVQVN